jgi:uncharacterized membrane protein YidH (DUF202 family)
MWGFRTGMAITAFGMGLFQFWRAVTALQNWKTRLQRAVSALQK